MHQGVRVEAKLQRLRKTAVVYESTQRRPVAMVFDASPRKPSNATKSSLVLTTVSRNCRVNYKKCVSIGKLPCRRRDLQGYLSLLKSSRDSH